MPLAEPAKAFTFDFRRAALHMQPEDAVVHLRFTTAGVFNAVAMWFELDLDEESSLRSVSSIGVQLAGRDGIGRRHVAHAA